MLNKLKSILTTQTFRQSIVTTTSVFLSSGLGAVYYLVLARVLGPHEYGLFSLAIAILSVAISVADLGISQGLVKFVGANREKNAYYPFTRIALEAKIITGFVICLIFAVGATFISNVIVHQPELKDLLPLVGVAVFCQLLYMLSASIFQGLQKFIHWGVLQVGTNLIRLILLVPLYFLGKLYSFPAFFIFTLSYAVGFGLSLLWIDKKWIKSKVETTIRVEFWNFNRWVGVVTILTSLTARLDTLLTGRFLSLADVGIYSLATTMSSFLPQFASAIGAVTTAKFAGIKDINHEKTYLMKSIFFVGLISWGVALLMIPVAWGVLILTGHSYQESFYPFLVLLFGTAFFVTTNPIRDSILYFHSNPKFFVFLNIFQGLLVVLCGFILIPKYRVLGSAYSVVISLVVCSLVTVFYYLRIQKKK